MLILLYSTLMKFNLMRIYKHEFDYSGFIKPAASVSFSGTPFK